MDIESVRHTLEQANLVSIGVGFLLVTFIKWRRSQVKPDARIAPEDLKRTEQTGSTHF